MSGIVGHRGLMLAGSGGGGGGGQTYRYWRIYITANNGDTYTAIQELEFRASPGGSDQSIPGMTTAASSIFGTNDSTRVIDNDFADYINKAWITSGGSPPHWVSVDLSSAVLVQEVAIWPQNYGGGPARAPKDFKIQGSPDNSTWTDVASLTSVTGWTAGTGNTYAIP